MFSYSDADLIQSNDLVRHVREQISILADHCVVEPALDLEFVLRHVTMIVQLIADTQHENQLRDPRGLRFDN